MTETTFVDRTGGQFETAPEELQVLHVDDDAAFLDLTADYLERTERGIEVLTVTSGARGLEVLNEKDVDCVVSDYDMPGMDGLGFLKAVQENEPGMPFVLFTGKSPSVIASEAIKAGVTTYLEKRMGTDVYELLANRIVNVVEQVQAERRMSHYQCLLNVVEKINPALMQATERAELETSVCEALENSQLYCFAQFVPPLAEDVPADRIAGDRESVSWSMNIDDSVSMSADSEPFQTALRENTGIVRRSDQSDTSLSLWNEDAEQCGYRAVAVIPISHDNRQYGVLCVYSHRRDAFQNEELRRISTLGDQLAHAIDGIEHG